MTGDAQIIQAVLAGDTERFSTLIARYQLATWRLAFSFVRNMEDAKEISQNGFIKAYRNLRWFRGEAEFSTWLYRIIVNECKNFLRNRAREPQPLSLSSQENSPEDLFPLDLPDTQANPRDRLVQKELVEQISRTVERLPMKQRMAFTLHHLNGLALTQVSSLMGCRVGTVKAHLFRAMETLRSALQPLLDASLMGPSARDTGAR